MNGRVRRVGLPTANRLRRLAQRIDRATLPFERLVWLVGGPRTGSTWLAAMLGVHPLIDVQMEPLLGAHLGAHAESTVETVLSINDASIRELSHERPTYFFSEASRTDWEPLLQDMIRTRLLKPSRTTINVGGIVVVKEPHGSEAADWLAELTPGSRLLVLVRDPRDVMDSALDIVESGWNGDSGGAGSLDLSARLQILERALEVWSRRAKAIERALEAMHTVDRLVVRYEDLRTDPHVTLRAVVEWLRLRAPDEWVRETIERTMFERAPVRRRGAGEFQRQAAPGGWRSALSPQEQRLINDVAGPWLRRNGYDLDGPERAGGSVTAPSDGPGGQAHLGP